VAVEMLCQLIKLLLDKGGPQPLDKITTNWQLGNNLLERGEIQQTCNVGWPNLQYHLLLPNIITPLDV